MVGGEILLSLSSSRCCCWETEYLSLSSSSALLLCERRLLLFHFDPSHPLRVVGLYIERKRRISSLFLPYSCCCWDEISSLLPPSLRSCVWERDIFLLLPSRASGFDVSAYIRWADLRLFPHSLRCFCWWRDMLSTFTSLPPVFDIVFDRDISLFGFAFPPSSVSWCILPERIVPIISLLYAPSSVVVSVYSFRQARYSSSLLAVTGAGHPVSCVGALTYSSLRCQSSVRCLADKLWSGMTVTKLTPVHLHSRREISSPFFLPSSVCFVWFVTLSQAHRGEVSTLLSPSSSLRV